MNIFKKLYNKIFKKKIMDDVWLDFYSEEDKSIKFTEKSIYNYLRDQVGDSTYLNAINYFGTRITYEDMFKKINAIARSLKILGVKKGDVVTICMPNAPEAIESFYACNLIGAVADMVHPLSAAKDIKFYLEESESRVLLLYDDCYDKVKDFLDDTKVYKTVLLSVSTSMPYFLGVGYKLTQGFKIKKPKKSDKEFMTWSEFLNLGINYKKDFAAKVNAKDLAVILHSGGTTGRSKGVMISNYNFNAMAQQCVVNFRKIKPQDKMLTIMPIFHGLGLGVCVHCPLTIKVEVILIPEFNNKTFHKIIKKYQPNIIAGVPTLFEAMVNNKKFDGMDLSFFKYLVCGGDVLNIAMEQKLNTFLRTHGANISILKGYGMTESVAATAYTFESLNEPGSIGIPMIGNDMCICNPGETEELPFGVEGEICVSGPTVMMGYLNNKEETDKVLIKHKDGKIWLHTGDLGYISLKGIVFFTQRLKRMFVSSGFNIFPVQIEEVITKHKHVKECCVIGVPHPYKIKAPKAFVVLDDDNLDKEKIANEIREMCKKELASYYKVKNIEFRKELPETLYKKIDYRKLERMEMENYEKKNGK